MVAIEYQNGTDARTDARRRRGGFWRWLTTSATAVAWQDAAADVGGRFVPLGLFGSPSVVLPVGPWTVTLDIYRVSKATYTRFRVPYVARRRFRLSVKRANEFTRLGEWLGFHDLRVGSPSFDDAFVVRGRDPHVVRAVLADPAVHGLLAELPDGRLRAAGRESWLNPWHLSRVDELTFVVPGVLRDVPRLRSAFNLMTVLTHQLRVAGRGPSARR